MLLLLAMLQLAGGHTSVGSLPAPPNILLILADDVGVDQVGCYAVNYPGLALDPCTPNLDQLAAGGLRFTNAWSNPVCSPTRAQIMTGKHARYTGIGNVTLPSDPAFPLDGMQVDEPTIASILDGWATAFVGKWHLSDSLQDLNGLKHPLRAGFDSYAGTLYGLLDYSDWTKVISPPGIEIHNYSVYTTTDTIDDALTLIPTLPEPWLLYVSPYASHKPFHCPTEKGFDPSICQQGACSQDWCNDCSSIVQSPLCAGDLLDGCYARAMTHSLDAQIGQLLAAIDADDTAVIFAGDNGTPKQAIVAPFDSEHSKGTVYQGGINVPLIVRTPGGATGVCNELVSMTDIFATVADLAGVQPAPSPGRESVSLMQYLEPGSRPGVAPRQHVYAEFFPENFPHEPDWGVPADLQLRYHHRAIRNDRYKLISFEGWSNDAGACQSRLELYRLADQPLQDPAFGPDPFEQHDLLMSPEAWTVEVRSSLDELLDLLEARYPHLPTVCD